MKTIIHTLHIHASPSVVHEALTTEDGVRGWWTTKATVEPGEGGIIRFNWADNTFSFALRDADGETSCEEGTGTPFQAR